MIAFHHGTAYKYNSNVGIGYLLYYPTTILRQRRSYYYRINIHYILFAILLVAEAAPLGLYAPGCRRRTEHCKQATNI